MNAAELKDFEAWLRSPWCNSNKNLIQLLARLKPHHPDFSDPKLNKEKLFRQVLPDGKYSERRMNNLLSEAYLSAERFLVFQRFASSKQNLQQALLAQELRDRALHDWFFREAFQEIARLEEKENKSWEDHLDLFGMLRRIYQHPEREAHLLSARATLAEMAVQTDILYLLEKAALINEMIFRNRIFKEENHDVPAELYKWHTAAEGIRHPVIDLYRMRFDLQETPPAERYEQLKAAFLERFGKLSRRDQNIHLLSLLNDAKVLVKSGSLDITECLPLYQLGLTTDTLLHNGKLSANTYMTIVTASNTAGTFDFSARFIEDYSPYLDEKVREDCAHWAKAHTAYRQNDLDASIAILQGYQFRSPDFKLISRVLTAQMYFDMYLKDNSYQSYLLQYFDTFEKWLNRDKARSTPSKVAFLRFVQCCRTLVRYHADVNPNPEKLEYLLENEGNVQALHWLKQKKEEVLKLKL